MPKLMGSWKTPTAVAAAVLLVLFVAGMVTAGFLALQRHQLEQAHRGVEIAVVYDEVVRAAQAHRITVDELVAQLAGAGLTGLLLKDQTVADSQEIAVIPAPQLRLLSLWLTDGAGPLSTILDSEGPAPVSYLITSEEERARELERILAAKGLLSAPHHVWLFPEQDLFVFGTLLTERDRNRVGLGFAGDPLQLAERHGLGLSYQFREAPGIAAGGIAPTMAAAQVPSLRAIYFNDNRVLGYPGALDEVVAQLGALDVPVGLIEGFEQRGLTRITARHGYRAVRMHSIREEELLEMSLTRAIDRYTLAVRERGIRTVLIRVYPATMADALERTVLVTGAVSTRLAADGYTLGAPTTIELPPLRQRQLLPMGVGVVAAAALVLLLLGWPYPAMLALMVGAAGWLAMVRLLDPLLAGRLMATFAAIVLPVLGLALLSRLRTTGWARAAAAVVGVTAVSVIGGLFVTGLLFHPGYVLTVHQFFAVRLALAAPLILFPALVLWQSRELDLSPVSWLQALRTPVRVGAVLVVLAALIAVAFFLMRSGNQPLIPATDFERWVRMMLGEWLGVRPRTKEFLFGIPALLLAFRWRPKNLHAVWLYAAAAVGQASVVNSFAHIHTPVTVSLVRTFHGLWLGLLIGLVLAWLIDRLLPVYRQWAAAAQEQEGRSA